MPKHTKPEAEPESYYERFQKEARGAPLTDEAKAHVHAAGLIADNRYAVMRAMVEAAIMPLVEANRHVGSDVTLSDEEVCRIVFAVRGALDYGHEEVVEPLFSRLRGEAPYVESIDLSTEEAS